MTIREEFGKNLRKLRLKNDMTQEDFAFFLDVTPGSLSYIETGKSFASAKLLDKICEVLKIAPSELFNFSDFKPNAEAEEIIRSINYNLPQLSIEKLKYINKIVRVFADKD